MITTPDTNNASPRNAPPSAPPCAQPATTRNSELETRNCGGSAAAPAPAISVANLRCAYDTATILDNITFTIPRGQIAYIVGGSGCGKSTLLKHMIGLAHPPAGAVSYFGENFTHAPHARRRDILKTFGVLYQSTALWTSFTLRENVSLPLEEHTTLAKPDRESVVALKLAQVGLTGYEDYYPSEISGGMKKRAGLARALALDPRIVFFDEPTAGLDPVSTRQLDTLLLTLRDTLATTLVIVSHDLDSIHATADRVLMLDRAAKGIIADGPPRALAASPDPRVREFFQRDETNTTQPTLTAKDAKDAKAAKKNQD